MKYQKNNLKYISLLLLVLVILLVLGIILYLIFFREKSPNNNTNSQKSLNKQQSLLSSTSDNGNEIYELVQDNNIPAIQPDNPSTYGSSPAPSPSERAYPINTGLSPVSSWKNKGLKRVFNLLPNTRYELTFNDLALVFKSDDEGQFYMNEEQQALPVNCLPYNIIILSTAQYCNDEDGVFDDCVWSSSGAPKIEVEETDDSMCTESITMTVLLNAIIDNTVRPIITENQERTVIIKDGALSVATI
jgi:hypothetical protein